MINKFDEEINSFIIKVFNYYNGKINPINKAVLDINWADLANCNDGGYSRPPNIIVINPLVISRYNEDIIDLKISIISTIIHELYHTDQVINYTLYAVDANYNKCIEFACEMETIIYIAGHQIEINNVFGLDIYFDKQQYDKMISYWHVPGVRYQRRYYHEHIFMCIDNMCAFSKEVGMDLHKNIRNAITNDKSIILEINKAAIFISYKGELMDINKFNELITPYQCNGLYKTDFEIIYEDGNVMVSLNIISKNIMCKKI